jgi:hypothetical protein
MDALLDSLPYWLAVVLLVGTWIVSRRFDHLPPVREAMSAVRSVLMRKFKPRLPRLTVVPQPLDPERPEDVPPAQVVTSDGTPVQMGRTEAEIERDARENGDGGA